MKSTILLGILLILANNLSAQREYLPTEEDLKIFHNTKTYIVLEDNPISEYNFEITDAVKKYWDITPYEFIKYDEFEKKSKDTGASFLYTARVMFEKDKSQTRYVFLCLSLGGEYPSLDEMKDVANVPLSYYGIDADRYAYKLGTMVNFLQKHVRMITEKPEVISQNVFKEYNDNMSDIHKKTLYLIEDELEKSISTESLINAEYPSDFKIVTKEDIKQAIMDKNEDVVFLHKVGPEGKKFRARVYKILIGAGDSEFYYFDYHKVNPRKPDAFLKKDLKKIAKAKD